jgi:hypothetical protein
MRFRAPSEDYLRDPARPRRPEGRHGGPCFLSWTLRPYGTLAGRWTRLPFAAPAANACRVRGLATPISAFTTVPTGARSAGAPLGFSLQGVLLVAAGTPLGGLALLALPRSIAPGGTTARGRLQGLDLATRAFGRRAPKNPTAATFLGFTPPELSPHPFGHALWSRCRPSHPFGGATSRPARVSGLREADESACPSPDCRLSWGSLPSDRRGTPFAGSGGGLMDSPRTRFRVCTEPRALSPLDADATRGPDP